jgi:hypothetical protein
VLTRRVSEEEKEKEEDEFIYRLCVHIYFTVFSFRLLIPKLFIMCLISSVYRHHQLFVFESITMIITMSVASQLWLSTPIPMTLLLRASFLTGHLVSLSHGSPRRVE